MPCPFPRTLWIPKGPGHEMIQAPCGKCKHCSWRRANQIIGQCMNEAAFSTPLILTMTYADQADRSHEVLNNSHPVAMVRALRKRGHSVRYFISGEYGKTGTKRAHWHAALFFRPNDKTTLLPVFKKGNRQRQLVDWWPYGYVFPDNLGRSSATQQNAFHDAFKYAAKYATKDLGGYWYSQSRKPSLGIEGVMEHAKQLSVADKLPRDFRYRPIGCDSDFTYVYTRSQQMDLLEELFRLAPHLENRKGGPFIETARKRLVQRRVDKRWKNMPAWERQIELSRLVKQQDLDENRVRLYRVATRGQ
jgi:hypothetical protein